MSVQVETHELNVAGLRVHVYCTAGLRDVRNGEPVAAVIGLHGRLSSAENMDETARDFVRWSEEKRAVSETASALVFITFVGLRSTIFAGARFLKIECRISATMDIGLSISLEIKDGARSRRRTTSAMRRSLR
jgi:hypothetical protein